MEEATQVLPACLPGQVRGQSSGEKAGRQVGLLAWVGWGVGGWLFLYLSPRASSRNFCQLATSSVA